eukprot:m.2361 g.2361  ORF g.2361 m.2361 type:complete len:507 (+) comp1541_c0_seq1:10-1530(+)
MARLLAIAVAFTLGITVAQFIILRLAAPSLVDVSQENEQLQARLQAADAERRQLLQVLDVERQTRTRYEAAAVAMNVSLQRVQGKLQTLAHASNTALEQAVSAQLQAEHTAREMENTALELQRSLYAALQSSSKNGQHGNTASQTKHQLQQLQIRQQGKDTRSLVVPMLGDWEEASDDDWYSLLRRRGCRDRGFREKVQCCEPQLWPNFTNPLRQLRFRSNYRLHMYKLERLLNGGTITFIGDSISAQIFDAMRARAVRENLEAVPTALTPESLVGTSVNFVRTLQTGQPAVAFTLRIIRADKVENFYSAVDDAISLQPAVQGQSNRPGDSQVEPVQHIVVGNLGLHFSDSHANETTEYVRQLRYLADRLQRFNALPGNFGFLRDITPQHFKSRDMVDEAMGDYAKRNRSVTHCSAWSSGLLSTRNNRHNQIMEDVAEEFGLLVQKTTPYLKERHDAHIETRDNLKNNILDCTHWCAAVFDVFEDTFLYILHKRYGMDPRLKTVTA